MMEFLLGVLAGLVLATLYWAPHYKRAADMTDEAIALAQRAADAADRAVRR